MRIDLNSDLGESFGRYRIGNDEELMKSITSCNIACGFHAGDPSVIRKTVELALKNSLTIGAHPSYPDFAGFGRREMDIPDEELLDIIIYQVCVLKSLVEAYGGKLSHVKPHGALYNKAARDRGTAEILCKAVKRIDKELYITGLSGSVMTEVAEENGLRVLNEVFSDREYEKNGALVSRNHKNALINDTGKCLPRVLEMVKNGRIASIDGDSIAIKAETLCIHGDGEHAVEFAVKIKEFLVKNGVDIASYASGDDNL